MQGNKKIILLITYDNWGYNHFIADALEKKGYEVIHINFHSFRYKYPSIAHKTFNFFTKNLGVLNLKKEYYHTIILDKLKHINSIHTAIYIKADFLSAETIKKINEKSRKSVLIVNDSINRYPKTKKILTLFDTVFSFEKKDCEMFNLRFKTNFIFTYFDKVPDHFEYKVFNISSFDRRFPVIKKIAEILHERKINTKIMIFTKKQPEYDYLEYTRKPLSIAEIFQYLEKSEIMLDVHRNEQQGLSFRVFESLGLHKKLITTNKDITTYDFYNPRNILVIDDIEDIKIPQDFLDAPYAEIPKSILHKYLVENWVDELVN